MMPFAWLGKLGPVELAILSAIGLLSFGNQIPRVMQALGQGIKQGLHDNDDQTGPFSIP